MDYMMRVMLAQAAGGGGGGGFSNVDSTPPSLGGGTGCRLYVALGHGLYTDNLTTLATAAGQSVYTWKDYSGNANHVVQGSGFYEPTVGSGAQVVFAYPSVMFIPSAVTSGVTDGEAFVLLKLDADPQVGTFAGGLWYLGGNDVGVYPYADGKIYEGAGTTGRYSFTKPSGLTSWHVYSVRTSGTNWQALKNNSALDSRTGNSVDWSPSGLIGASLAASNNLYGQIAAVVFYDGARSNGERSSIVSTLLGMAPP